MVSAQSTVACVTHSIYRSSLVDCTEGAERDSGVPLSCRRCVYPHYTSLPLWMPLTPGNQAVSDMVLSVD